MLDSALKIKKYTEHLDFDGFINDDKTIDAVVRNLEIIGEASNRIDSDFKAQNPDIEWKRIRGLRNRIVHDYFGIDHEIVWSIVDNDLGNFIDRLRDLINIR
jgi:uncharacterized protein with HEPN domain